MPKMQFATSLRYHLGICTPLKAAIKTGFAVRASLVRNGSCQPSDIYHVEDFVQTFHSCIFISVPARASLGSPSPPTPSNRFRRHITMRPESFNHAVKRSKISLSFIYRFNAGSHTTAVLSASGIFLGHLYPKCDWQ